MKKILLSVVLIAFTLSLVGCGETLNGAVRDVRRMGKGIKTIFVRDAE